MQFLRFGTVGVFGFGVDTLVVYSLRFWLGLYLAGIVSAKAKGKSMTEQTKEILGLIDGLLAKAGTDKSKLLTTNIWITDMANFAEMNAVWDAWVSPGNTPARATVQAGLAAPDYKVEIMVTAAK